MPKVFIALATYQGARYLRPLIESIRRQSYEDWTLLARDDGSIDATGGILAELARRDGRIHVLDDGGRRVRIGGKLRAPDATGLRPGRRLPVSGRSGRRLANGETPQADGVDAARRGGRRQADRPARLFRPGRRGPAVADRASFLFPLLAASAWRSGAAGDPFGAKFRARMRCGDEPAAIGTFPAVAGVDCFARLVGGPVRGGRRPDFLPSRGDALVSPARRQRQRPGRLLARTRSATALLEQAMGARLSQFSPIARPGLAPARDWTSVRWPWPRRRGNAWSDSAGCSSVRGRPGGGYSNCSAWGCRPSTCRDGFFTTSASPRCRGRSHAARPAVRPVRSLPLGEGETD